MFQGDEPAIRMVLRRAVGSAHRLGHPRVGVEHLLVGLAGGNDVVATVLARHGATCYLWRTPHAPRRRLVLAQLLS